MPELFNSLEMIRESGELKKFNWNEPVDGKLTVRVNSFSYRKKLPADLSGNGGGFVFDCRAIPNPGRLDHYKQLNGKDKPVQDFLEEQPEAQRFLHESFDIVKQSVENYIKRNWTDFDGKLRMHRRSAQVCLFGRKTCPVPERKFRCSCCTYPYKFITYESIYSCCRIRNKASADYQHKAQSSCRDERKYSS